MTLDVKFARRIGRKVQRARERAGLTRAELATLIDVSRQHVHAIETGKSVPGVAILTAMGEVLGRSVMP